MAQTKYNKYVSITITLNSKGDIAPPFQYGNITFALQLMF